MLILFKPVSNREHGIGATGNTKPRANPSLTLYEYTSGTLLRAARGIQQPLRFAFHSEILPPSSRLSIAKLLYIQ